MFLAGRQNSAADPYPARAAAPGALPNRGFPRCRQGSQRQRVPGGATRRPQQTRRAAGVYRDGRGSGGATHVLPGLQGVREELDAVRRTEARGHHGHRGGHETGRRHDGDVRLRRHSEGAQRGRRAPVSGPERPAG
uniref:(northern house mosquito) hypothetical protein n=1 Tax=Culex pipiens TaxID=7175 RepID=A0A8D8A216_CULPI